MTTTLSFIQGSLLKILRLLEMKGQGELTPPRRCGKSNDSTATPGRQRSKLPEAIDKTIVYYVGTNQLQKFSDLCDNDQDTYGSPASAIRRKCQYRVQTLKKFPQTLERKIREYYKDSLYLFETFLSTRLASDNQSIASNGSTSVASFATPPRSSKASRVQRTISPLPWSPTGFSPLHFPYQPPRNIMASLTAAAADITDNNSFQLHFDDPASNPKGVTVIRLNDVSTGTSLVGMVSIYFEVSNMNDFDQFSCRLSEDGSSLIVTDYAQPTPLLEDVRKLHYFTASNGEDPDDKVYINALSVQAEMIRKAKKVGSFNKDFYFKFPNGITCNSDHFNPSKKNQLGVDSQMTLLPYETKSKMPDGSNIAMMPTMKVRLAIDGDDRAMSGSSNAVNDITDALAQMKLKMEKFKKG